MYIGQLGELDRASLSSSSSSSCWSHGWSSPLLAFGLIKSLQVRSPVDSQKTEYRKLLQWWSILPLKLFSVGDSSIIVGPTTSSGRRTFHIQHEHWRNLLSVLSCSMFSGSLNSVLLSQTSSVQLVAACLASQLRGPRSLDYNGKMLKC